MSKSRDLHRWIKSNEKALQLLHEGMRSSSPKDEQYRRERVTRFYQQYDVLAFPGGLENGMRALDMADPDVIESAVAFLEVDPIFFRSGYIKADILRRLKRSPLSADQKARLRVMILGRVEGSDTREFRHYCQLARTIADKDFHSAIASRLESSDQRIARHAKWVIDALENHPPRAVK